MLFDHVGDGGDYEQLVVHQDPGAGVRILIAIHSTRRGPAFGGIRRRAYPTEFTALADVLSLAEAMSLKCALVGLPAGGGKTVVWPDPSVPLDRAAAYRSVGRLVKGMGGRYVCGPDIGTEASDLAEVRRQTRFVNPEPNDAGVSTAAGVEAGMRAVARAIDRPIGAGLTVAIQGLGAVGRNLARSLLARGVTVIGSDLRPEAMAAAGAVGVEVVSPEALLGIECDILSPCAVGGVLDEDVVPALRCRAICGSANNQLASAVVAQDLVARGIVFAPDLVVSAGAVTEGVYTVFEGDSEAVRRKIRDKIDGFEGITSTLLDEAARKRLSPHVLARARGRAILEGA